MTDQYNAVVYNIDETLYVLNQDDPEAALEAGAFTPNRSEAQIFEGEGWAAQVAGFGAVLERVFS